MGVVDAARGVVRRVQLMQACGVHAHVTVEGVEQQLWRGRRR
jgi:hypothetical protein